MSWFTDNGLPDPTTGPSTLPISAGFDPTLGTGPVYQPNTTTTTADPNLQNFITNYWAPDRAQVLASMGYVDPNAATTTPTTPASSGGPTGAPLPQLPPMQPQITNPNDPQQIQQWLNWRATQPGADPILQTPQGVQYYLQAILSHGGLTDQNYWTNKSTLAQFGGAVGAGGGSGLNALAGLGGSGSLAGTYPGGQFTPPSADYGSLPPWAQPYGEKFTAPSTSLSTLPSWAQPYGKTYVTQPYGKEYTLPTAEEARQTPGYQFAFDQGIQGIDRGAAARGNLQTGGTLKAEQQYGTGLADTYYQNRVNNSLAQFGTNYGVFQGDQARALDAFQTNYGVFSGDQNRAASAYQQAFGNSLAGYNTNLNTYLANAGLANSAYQNQFNNALNTYGANFNVWNTVGNNLFNRYNTLAQYGLAQ